MYLLLFTWTSDSFSCSVYKFHQQAVDALTESLAPLFSFWASKLELCASLSHLDNCNKTKIKILFQNAELLFGERGSTVTLTYLTKELQLNWSTWSWQESWCNNFNLRLPVTGSEGTSCANLTDSADTFILLWQLAHHVSLTCPKAIDCNKRKRHTVLKLFKFFTF